MAIAKSNKLVETSYKLGSREQFFVLFLLSKISQHDTEFRQYRVHHKDIARIMNFDGRRRVANKEDIFKMMNNLNTQPIRFSEGDEDVQAVWITSLRYNRKSGEYTFTFSLELKPFLLQLKEHFTLFNISNVVYLSGHSTRMYEVLKRHQFKREPVVLGIKDLKFWLRIESKYPEFYEFKRWVLEPAKQELEQYTDIRFTYVEAEKEGKKILSLEFTIYENEPKEHPAALNLLTTIGERLRLAEPTHNIMPDAKSAEATSSTDRVGQGKKDKLAHLTAVQRKAFELLTEKGVNATFVLETIFKDPKVNYEPLKGFEDLYFHAMWSFFDAKSQSKQKAGAFVNWFKSGKLTEDGLHARLIETVLERRKTMKEAEREERLVATVASQNPQTKTAVESAHTPTQNADLFSYTEGVKIMMPDNTPVRDYAPMRETMNRILKKQAAPVPIFDIEEFKKEFSEQYQAALDKAKEDYTKFYAEMGNQPLDLAKHAESIEHRAKEYCRDWLKEAQSE